MSFNYDAFTEGVILGGLRTKNDIKILLCYILNSLSYPISKDGLTEAIQTTQLANFFEVNDSLKTLCDNGLIKSESRDSIDYLSLTPKGADVAQKLETDIPYTVRETAVKAAVKLLNRERIKESANAVVKKLDKGYNVVLTVHDKDSIMMQTVLYVADSLQADTICETFMEDPTKLYSAIIDTITD